MVHDFGYIWDFSWDDFFHMESTPRTIWKCSSSKLFLICLQMVDVQVSSVSKYQHKYQVPY